MAVDTEYYWQRPSCEYFIGLARGMGITVYLPDDCDLLKTRFLYAIHEDQELAFSKKIKGMRKSMMLKHQTAVARMKAEHQKVEQYVGAISAANVGSRSTKDSAARRCNSRRLLSKMES